MGNVSPAGAASTDKAIQDMKDTFDQAVTKSSEITKMTTGKKVELDAAKQRPNN